jgi:hypothetical protein
MKITYIISFFILFLFSQRLYAADEVIPPKYSGTFYHAYWYEAGVEHGNPKFNSRFRVNSPSVVLHPEFGKRVEAKANGMMQIFIDEDLSLIDGAELYMEIWGGHPHTENKRITINGRSTYYLPEVGTASGNCTHMYPTIPIKITDLVNGYNVLQFACDQGESFWGHFIVDEACLRLKLKPEHPALQVNELKGFDSKVEYLSAHHDGIIVSEHISIKTSVIQAKYFGYDENGDGDMNDWHGFTINRKPVGYFENIDEESVGIVLLEIDKFIPQPLSGDVPIRAWIDFKYFPKLIYLTKESTMPYIGLGDRIYLSNDLPVPFWSRAGNLKTCTIEIDVDPSDIEAAQLHCVVWDGGHGTVEDYFKLNGHSIKVAGEGKHDVIYSEISIDPAFLKNGVNTIELLSDTEHHGIEILLPGPAVAVKLKD